MFEGLIHKAQGIVDSALAKLVGRAAVAVPLVIAVGFGIAALTTKLTEVYGPTASYSVMAVLFALLAGAAAVVVAAMAANAEKAEKAEEEASAKIESLSDPITPVLESVAPLLDKDVLMAALTTAGPIALPRLARLAARNLPLLIMAALVGIFFLSRSQTGAEDAATASGDASMPTPAPAE